MTTELTESRRAALRAVCDTIVPRIEREQDPDGFWARSATDVGVDEAVVQVLATLPDEQRAGMLALLDGLDAQGIARVSPRSREQILATVALLGSQAAAGVGALVGLMLFLAYGVPDPETGQNPIWTTFGYPGPIAAPPDEPEADRRRSCPRATS